MIELSDIAIIKSLSIKKNICKVISYWHNSRPFRYGYSVQIKIRDFCIISEVLIFLSGI